MKTKSQSLRREATSAATGSATASSPASAARRVKPQYGRVVWKRGRDGTPEPVREEFPDEHTVMKPVRMLELAVECGVQDLEVVTEYALYGMK